MGINPVETILKTYEIREFTLSQRILTQFRVIIFYISLLVFPHPSRLNLLHDFPLSYSLFNPITTLFSLIAILGAIGLAIRIAKKEHLISFCILWYFGNLVIESSVIGLEIIYEHRNYLPSMFASLLFVILTSKISHVFPRQNRTWQVGLSLVVIIFSFWTYQRNQIWGGDEKDFWKDCLEKSPNYVRLYNKIGSTLLNEGKVKEAMGYFSKAVRIRPNYAASAHNNLGYSLLLQGKTQEAMKCFSKAIQIRPDFHIAQNNMGHSLMIMGRTKEAIPYFFRAIQLNPNFSEAYYNLASALFILKKYSQSVYYYSESLRLNPDSADAHYYLGRSLEEEGKTAEAIQHYSKALKLSPDFEKARQKLEKIRKSS
jgi:tetratricopeptide (TPR) repeat protein